MSDCLFCKIAAGSISVRKVYEDEQVMAFWDIAPQAPVHILVIPKKHIASIIEVDSCDSNLVMQLFKVVQHVAQEMKVRDDGFRLVVNTADNGGQTVPHLHFHLLGGRFMTWPPG